MQDDMVRVLLVEPWSKGMSPTFAQLTHVPGKRLYINFTTTYKDAVYRLGVNQYDLVLLSYHLPDMDGLQALAGIKDVAKSIPVASLLPADEGGLAEVLSENGSAGIFWQGGVPVDTVVDDFAAIIDAYKANAPTQAATSDSVSEDRTEQEPITEEVSASVPVMNEDAEDLTQSSDDVIDLDDLPEATASVDKAALSIDPTVPAQEGQTPPSPSLHDVAYAEGSIEATVQHDALEESVRSLQAQIAALREQLEHEQSLRITAEESAEELDTRCQELEAGQTALIEAEHVAIDRERAARESAEAEVEQLTVKVAALESEVPTVPESRFLEEEQLRKEAEGTIRALEARTTELNEAHQAYCADLEDRLAAEQHATEALDNRLNEAQIKLAEFEDEVNKLRNEHREKRSLEKHLGQLERRCKELEGVEEEVKRSEYAMQQAQDALGSAEARISELEAEQAEHVALRDERDELARRLEELDTRIMRERDTHREEIEALQNEMDGVQAERGSLETSMLAELDACKQQVGAGEAERRELEKKLATALRHADELSKVRETLKSKEWALAEAETALQSAEARLEESAAESKTLIEKVSAAEQLQAQYDARGDELHQLRTTLQEAQAQSETLTAELDVAREAGSQLNQDIKHQVAATAQAEEQVKLLTNRCEELEESLKQADGQVASHETKQRTAEFELQQRIQDLEAQLKSMNSKLSSAQEAVTRAEARCNRMETSHASEQRRWSEREVEQDQRLDDARTRLKSEEERRESTESLLHETKEQIAEQESIVEGLREDLALVSSADPVEVVEIDDTAAQESVLELSNELNALKVRLEAAEEASNAFASSAEEVAALTQKVQDAESRLHHTEAELQSEKKLRLSLESSLAGMRADTQNPQSTLPPEKEASMPMNDVVESLLATIESLSADSAWKLECMSILEPASGTPLLWEAAKSVGAYMNREGVSKIDAAKCVSMITQIREFQGQKAESSTEPTTVVFGTSGWRGVIGEDFTVMNVHKVARGIVEMMQSKPFLTVNGYNTFEEVQQHGIVVFRDNRYMGDRFMDAAMAELAGAEVRIHFAGECPTGVGSALVTELSAAGSINFTPSHNPMDYAGIKFNPADGGPAGPELTTIIEEKANAYMQDGATFTPNSSAPAALRTDVDAKKVFTDYVLYKSKVFDLTMIRNWLIEHKDEMALVVDFMHGSSRGYIQSVLGVTVCDALKSSGGLVFLNENEDYSFHGVKPEPSAANQAPLLTILKEMNRTFSLAVALDPDADRIRFADADLDIDMNRFGAIAYASLLQSGCKGGIASTAPSSDFALEIAKKEGMQVFETAVGFKNFREPLGSGEAVLAFEESDGISCMGHTLEKCAIAGFLLALKAMVDQGTNISTQYAALREKYGYFYPSKAGADVTGVSVEAWQAYKKAVVEALQNDLYAVGDVVEIGGQKKTVAEINVIDGLKMIFDDKSWILLRPSGTEPKFRYYFELASTTALEDEAELLAAYEEAGGAILQKARGLVDA